MQDLISVVAVRALLAELQRRGASTGELLVGRLAHPAFLGDMRCTITLDEFESALATARRITGDDALGLSIGMHASASTFKLPAHLALMARTLREAFDVLNRYLPLIVGGVAMSLETGGERARITLHIARARRAEASTRFLVEVFASTLFRFAHDFAPGIRLHGLSLSYPAPAYASRYARVFGCVPRFGQGVTFAELDAAVLSAEQTLTDLPLLSMLRVDAENMLSAITRTPTMSERVLAVLRARRDLGSVQAEAVAAELGISWRKLRGTLRDQDGVTLSQLIDKVRLEAASDALLRPDSSIKAVADRLGYSEPSAFNRAFKRWTGLAPRAFVSEQRTRRVQLTSG